jgi:hypothetical protein
VPHLHARHVSFAVVLAVVAFAVALLPSRSPAHDGPSAPGEAASVNETRAAAAPVPPAVAFATGTPAFQQALAVATGRWGGMPCQGNVTYEWLPMEALTNARASWHNPTDAWAAPATNFNCHVAFNTSASFDFPQFCTVLAHELGHLLGQPHDPASGQLMSAIYTEPTPECAAADPVAVAAKAAAAASADQAATRAANVASSSRRARGARSSTKARTSPLKTRTATKSRKVVRRHTAGRRAKRGKRCLNRMKAGKRVKRCAAVPRRAARRS